MASDLRAPLLAACLILAGYAGQASAESSVPSNPQEAQREAMEDPMVCKRFTPTGSRISKKFCYKRSEWDAMREGGQRAARDAAIERSQYGYRDIGPGGTNPY